MPLQHWSELHEAARVNNVERAERLLEGASSSEALEWMVAARDQFGWTPLHVACANKALETAKVLIDNGGDVNATDEEGATPLIVAAKYKMWDLVKLLLNQNAVVTAKKEGDTVLHYALKHGNWAVMELLLRKPGSQRFINTSNGNCNTPLMLAAMQNAPVKVIKRLLYLGASVAMRNSRGQTCMDLALEKKNDSLVEFFESTFSAPWTAGDVLLLAVTRDPIVFVIACTVHAQLPKLSCESWIRICEFLSPRDFYSHDFFAVEEVFSPTA